jgi:hypothetical protein
MNRCDMDNSGPRRVDNGGLITIEVTRRTRFRAAKERTRSPNRPSATIVCFPVSRRMKLVRATATELANRDYDSGRRYWGEHVQHLRAELRQAGASPLQIRYDLARYAKAVGEALLAS